MKEYRQEPGGRRVKGDDLKAIQEIALISEKFLAQHGSFVISGCEVNGTNITSGIVMLDGKACTFNGASEATFPYYIKKSVASELVPYESQEKGAGYEVYSVIEAVASDSGAFCLDSAPRFKDIFKPKNAVNADTLNSKSAAAFAPSGFGFGETSVNINNKNLVSYLDKTRLAYGYNVTGAPRTDQSYAFFIQSNGSRAVIIAVQISGIGYEVGYSHLTTYMDGTLNPWRNIADGGNASTLAGRLPYSFTYDANNVEFGGNSNTITTAQFIAQLNSKGAFNHTAWIARGTWSFARNQVISDTGVGNIGLAGAVVEVFSNADGGGQYVPYIYTIRITTSNTYGAGNAEPKRVYIYNNHGAAYGPGWYKLVSTVDGAIDSTGLVSNSLVRRSGTQINSATGFYQQSDERLKDIKEDFKPELEDIMKLPLFYYTLKNNPDKTEIGTSAQKLLEKFPEMVSKNEDGYYSVAYDKLAILALKGIALLKEELTSTKKALALTNDRLSKIEDSLNKE